MVVLGCFDTLCCSFFLLVTICICYGKQDVLPVQVDIVQLGDDTLNDVLNLTIRCSSHEDEFRFHLSRKYERPDNLPIFLPSRNGITRSSISHQKIKTPYQDTKYNALFFVDNTRPGPRAEVVGTFIKENVHYTLKSKRDKTDTSYLLIRQHRNNNDTQNEVEKITNTLYLPWIQKKHDRRTKRQTILYEIELFVAIDHSIYDVLAKDFSTTDLTDEQINDLVVEEIQTHYQLILHGVQSRFETIHGMNYRIAVNLVGVFIANVSYASPWTYNTTYKDSGSEKLVLSSEALSVFSSWLQLNKDILPSFDHAMAFTANNLAHRENLKTLGVASQQSMCTERSLSMIEDHDNAAYTSYVAAHELAHSLGAKHDGSPLTVKYRDRSATCGSDDGFVMSPQATSTPSEENSFRSWQFSSCSHLYFDFYIEHLNSVNNNCLLLAGITVRSQTTQIDPSPYSPDEQCARVHGVGMVMDRVLGTKNPDDICRSIPCIRAGTRSRSHDVLETLAMEGTTCGVHRVCRRGRCEHKVDTKKWYDGQKSTDSCIFGDQPGIISNTNMTCEQLISKQPSNCYIYEDYCCSSCRHHLRQSVLSGCRYGDRIKDCDWRMCDGDECCESCAIRHGNLNLCPEIQIQPPLNITSNTETYHHGTVLRFSCHTGFGLDGTDHVTCTANGTWSDRAPTCYRGCPKFDVPPWMSLVVSNGNYTFGTLAHFRCLHGLKLTGEGTLRCLNSSVWNYSMPTCHLTFTSQETLHVPENTRDSTPVYRLLTGSDACVYELIGMSHRGFIVMTSGTVFTDVSAMIDCEIMHIYRLHVRATLSAFPMFYASQVLTIFIDDVNEYEPQFEKPVYMFNIPTDTKYENMKEQVIATDQDASSTHLTYTIAENESNYYNNTIQINSSSGIFAINTSLLQNGATGTFKFTVLATDDGLPSPRTGSATILICLGGPCSGQSIPVSYRSSLFLVFVVHLRVMVQY